MIKKKKKSTKRKGGYDHLKKYHFKPGHSGNPHGAPKTQFKKELRALRGKLNIVAMESIAGMLSMNREQLREVLEDKNSSMIQLQVATLIFHSVEAKDFQIFDGILSRLLGRPHMSVDLSTTDDSKNIEHIVQDSRKLIENIKSEDVKKDIKEEL